MSLWTPSPELKALLEARAKDYGPAVTLDVEQNRDWLVILKSGKTKYCLPAVEVNRVVRLDRVVRLPESPGYLLGLIQTAGEITPLIAIGRLLGDTTTGSKGPEAVIIGSGEERLGILSEELVKVIGDPGGEGGGNDDPLIARTLPGIGAILHVDGLLRLGEEGGG